VSKHVKPNRKIQEARMIRKHILVTNNNKLRSNKLSLISNIINSNNNNRLQALNLQMNNILQTNHSTHNNINNPSKVPNLSDRVKYHIQLISNSITINQFTIKISKTNIRTNSQHRDKT
jgi:hypothetical protein